MSAPCHIFLVMLISLYYMAKTVIEIKKNQSENNASRLAPLLAQGPGVRHHPEGEEGPLQRAQGIEAQGEEEHAQPPRAQEGSREAPQARQDTIREMHPSPGAFLFLQKTAILRFAKNLLKLPVIHGTRHLIRAAQRSTIEKSGINFYWEK